MSGDFLFKQGYNELVDFKEVIGAYKNPMTTLLHETTRGIIHYSKEGAAHIIPTMPTHYQFDMDASNNEELNKRSFILLSVLRALIGAVPSSLRGVFFGLVGYR